MRTTPSAQTKVLAVIALVIGMGSLVAIVTGVSDAAFDVLLVAMPLALLLMVLSQYRDTRRQSGR